MENSFRSTDGTETKRKLKGKETGYLSVSQCMSVSVSDVAASRVITIK